MGAMLAAGGLINGGALLGMLSDTHTLLFSSKSERTEGHTGGEWRICVCECGLCQYSQTSNWPPELWFIAACHCPNVCKSMRLIIDHVCGCACVRMYACALFIYFFILKCPFPCPWLYLLPNVLEVLLCSMSGQKQAALRGRTLVRAGRVTTECWVQLHITAVYLSPELV